MFRCSIAISPPDKVLEQIRQLKQHLQSAIGWYGSVNALAHITFNVFQTDAGTLPVWEAYTARFAAQQSVKTLRFNRTGTFANGAFFLAPDESTERILTYMMQAFHRGAPFPATHQSVKPHMSLGRQLKPRQLSVARTLIPEADIHFICNGLVIRRFNEAVKQYDIYRRFDFKEAGIKKCHGSTGCQ